jgi:peptide/nickel transport system substrate-binding protein
VTNTYDRRQFLAHSAAAAGGAVVAGALVDELSAGPAGAATHGYTLNVGLISEQHRPFTPDYANMDQSGFWYGRLVYDPLCVTSSDGKTVYPYLAESVTPNAAFTAWTIKARPKVKFHNGAICDARAIYDNLRADYSSSLTGASLKALIASITLDEAAGTVTVHTKYKWTSFPYTLAEQQIGFIAEPTTLGTHYSGLPIGTGPFIANTWNYNVSFKATRNPVYWRPGLPYLNAVVLQPIPDDQTRYTALTDGNLDMIVEDTGSYLVKFPALGGGYNYVTDIHGKLPYSPSSNCIMMNCKKAPFNNLNFRKAVASAIDKVTFNKFIDKSQSAPIDGIYLPGTPYYKKPPYPPFSKPAAASYLKKSGLPKSKWNFTLVAVNSPIVLQSATLVQSFLKAVGITVTIKPVSQAQLIGDAIFSQYQAMTWSQFGGVSPDTNYPWFSTKTGLNFANNDDAKIESAMLAGMAASTTAGRVKSWSFVNDQLGRDVPYAWTDRAVIGVAAHTKVQNWKTFNTPAGKGVLQPNQGVMFCTEIWKTGP